MHADETGLPGPSGGPLFTVFTATYNRAHTIHRVYDCLRAQTLRDFEWLVIDDGSTDGTPELIASWAKTADFPIRYVQQKNGGKHIAHNRALIEASGGLFATIDSDDALVPDALEKMACLWDTIPEHERRSFFAVGGRCCDQHGKIVGDRFPADPFDADMRQLLYVHRILGEKCILGLTDVMRRYPFPEIPGTYLPEGLLWLDVAKTFRTRWSNEVVRIYYVDDPATGMTITKVGRRGHHALGRWHYYVWLLNNDLEFFFRSPMPFLKAATALPICGWSSGKTIWQSLQALENSPAKLLVWSMLPLSGLFYLLDNFRPFKSYKTWTEKSPT